MFASPCSDREPLPGSPACNNGFERATRYDEPILVKRTQVEDKDRPLGCRIGSLERLGARIDETAWKVIRDVEEWPRETFQAQGWCLYDPSPFYHLVSRCIYLLTDQILGFRSYAR